MIFRRVNLVGIDYVRTVSSIVVQVKPILSHTINGRLNLY